MKSLKLFWGYLCLCYWGLEHNAQATRNTFTIDTQHFLTHTLEAYDKWSQASLEAFKKSTYTSQELKKIHEDVNRLIEISQAKIDKLLEVSTPTSNYFLLFFDEKDILYSSTSPEYNTSYLKNFFQAQHSVFMTTLRRDKHILIERLLQELPKQKTFFSTISSSSPLAHQIRYSQVKIEQCPQKLLSSKKLRPQSLRNSHVVHQEHNLSPSEYRSPEPDSFNFNDTLKKSLSAPSSPGLTPPTRRPASLLFDKNQRKKHYAQTWRPHSSSSSLEGFEFPQPPKSSEAPPKASQIKHDPYKKNRDICDTQNTEKYENLVNECLDAENNIIQTQLNVCITLQKSDNALTQDLVNYLKKSLALRLEGPFLLTLKEQDRLKIAYLLQELGMEKAISSLLLISQEVI